VTIDANELERMAKERPDDSFLKGSGILKLIGGIRQLEGEMRVALALLNECVGPLEVSAAVIEDEDGGEAIETLIKRVKAFCAASYLSSATAGVPALADPVAAERERCASIADDEARLREEAGIRHVESSLARERCFAGARAAANVAKGIRCGEVVGSAAQLALPHPIGTIFSDGYWNLNVVLRDAVEVEPTWIQRGQADVYTADQVRELLRAHGATSDGGVAR
jgi:hypothetical protein